MLASSPKLGKGGFASIAEESVEAGEPNSPALTLRNLVYKHATLPTGFEGAYLSVPIKTPPNRKDSNIGRAPFENENIVNIYQAYSQYSLSSLEKGCRKQTNDPIRGIALLTAARLYRKLTNTLCTHRTHFLTGSCVTDPHGLAPTASLVF